MENKTTGLEKIDPTKKTQSPQAVIKDFFLKDSIKGRFQELLGKKAQGFVTSLLQCVAQNQNLAKADIGSIYQAAMTAATLDLPLNNNLGFAYIIPYKKKSKDEKGVWQTKEVAQFQMGYKGFIQLAQRSGQFKTISATAIYEGQLIEQNPLTGFVFDFTKKTSDKVIGYAAFFQLLNGFEKTLFLTMDELKKHGGKYSKSFNDDKGLWNTDFESMAIKTVIKLLLSKFAPLSIEMQRAVITDQAVINDAETQDVTYVDHEEIPVDKTQERLALMIGDATTIEQLNALEEHLDPELTDLFNNKKDELLTAAI